MKVLAINGSPRKHLGSTHSVLVPLLRGMASAGAETELVSLRGHRINPCIGCFKCWDRHPGKCIFKDGMPSLYEKFHQADFIIFGTPLYHSSMSGLLKDFVDRLLPRMEPWLVPHGDTGLTTHPIRTAKPSKIFLVSVCGFPEYEHFSSLVATFRQIADMQRWEYAGELLKAGAEPLAHKEYKEYFESFYQTVALAGRQLVEVGRVSEETNLLIRKGLLSGSKKRFVEASDVHWKRQIKKYRNFKGDALAETEGAVHPTEVSASSASQ